MELLPARVAAWAPHEFTCVVACVTAGLACVGWRWETSRFGCRARSRALPWTGSSAASTSLDAGSASRVLMRGALDALTPMAGRWLAEMDRDPPPVLASVAGAIRRGGEARARARTPKGQWLVFHGAHLDGDPQGRTSVIVEPPRPADLSPLIVAAYGLSERELAVTGHVLRGRSTQQIGRRLAISPYTVQEHLRSVFEKVGVHSRGELVGQIFFRHCLPVIED